MLSRLRARLTFANVVSLLALFVALATGGAYAANTIYSEDIVDGQVMRQDIAIDAVTGAKIHDGTISTSKYKSGSVTTSVIKTGAVSNLRLAPDAVTGDKVANGSLTGDDIDPTTLHLSGGVVARARGAGDVTGGLSETTYPLTDNSWIAQPGESDVIYGDVALTAPACNAEVSVLIRVDGTLVQMLTMNSANIGPMFSFGPWTYMEEPSSATPRTVTLGFYDACQGPDHAVAHSARVNVVGVW